jgi:ribosomal protein S18 acetylase RimI-like enzyme
MNIQIKPVASEQEITIIAGLAKIIWNQHYVSIIGEDQVNYMLNKYQTSKAINSQIKTEGYEYFMIRSEGKPVGYIGIIHRHSELFLSKFYVLDTERGKGIGHEGLDFLITKCKAYGSDFITLTVNKNNLDAISAYEKMGFERYGEVESDIGSGYVMDDYLMRLRMSPR